MRPLIFTEDISADVRDRLLGLDLISVDTETSGLSWRSDRLHLCQLYSGLTGPVLVHRVRSRPVNLAMVLEDPSCRKVFHYAPFDLKFLRSQWGVAVTNVACTKAASKLLYPAQPPDSHSLQALLKRELGVELSKGAVRTSDWSQAELSAEQVAYAAGDVTHLSGLLRVLERSLHLSGLAELYREVCRYMPIAARLEVAGIPDPLEY